MSKSTGAGGFTLIEIILAIIVISVAVLGLISSISFTTQGGLNAEVMSTAKELAQERMEQLMAQKRNSGFASLSPIGLGTYAAVSGFTGYERREDICYVDSGLNPNPNPPPPTACSAVATDYKQVTVNVRYAGLPNLASPAASIITVVTNVRE